MEESKEVKMTPTKGGKGNAQPEKMSYEQMVNIANQLQGQNRELMRYRDWETDRKSVV